MHVLYEEDGGFKAATVLSSADASYQVETPHGKRVKIKTSNVILQFERPTPAELLVQAEQCAQDIDLDFLWEVAPEEDFDAQHLGLEYFGHAPTPVEATALLIRLHHAPMYFYKRGKGKYKAAPQDALKAALASVEKKKALAAQQAEYVAQMKDNILPDAIAAQALALLTQPDKNSLEYKALEEACAALQMPRERLLLKLGALPNAFRLHELRFLSAYFPKGIEFPLVEIPALDRELPLAAVQAFSIDDASTTEIDDAFSVTETAPGHYRIGIHIAAPALVVTRDSPLDVLARARMSTVYTPGGKITMQPDALVDRFTLAAGSVRPALSLYVTTQAGSWQAESFESRLECVPIVANLRHHELDHVTDAAFLADPATTVPFKAELSILWSLAQTLCAERDAVRGKPEVHTRVDYSFQVDGNLEADAAQIDAARIRIEPRRRDALFDRLVAEYMILANRVWGKLLADCGAPGVYRSQQFGRVKMSTHPMPHQSIGVAQYAWCTSPLRRYIDLVNQWQIIACLDHGIAAPLAAPFKPKDADLFAIIGAFEALYTAYGEHQDAMERYWCLRWLKQENICRLEATVLRDDLVRCQALPLVIRVSGVPPLERGHRILLDVTEMDEITLELGCRFVGVVEALPDSALPSEEEIEPNGS